MVGARDLARAAAVAIAAAHSNGTAATLASYRRGLEESRAQLLQDDAEGALWPAGLVAASERLAAADARYSFCLRLARSAYFGAFLVRVVAREALSDRDPAPQAVTVGRLVNMFITTFDGICDEVPEFLPEVLPSLDRIFHEFPNTASLPDESDHPVVQLTIAAAVSATAHLRAALTQAPISLRERFDSAVRMAFEAQMGSLQVLMPTASGSTAERRQSLSRAAFRVSVLIPVAFSRNKPPDVPLSTVADALGDYFGWIDDLVDIESDSLSMRENMVRDAIEAAFGMRIGPRTPYPDAALGLVRTEATLRWSELVKRLAHAGLDSTKLVSDITTASLAWLGLAPSDIQG